MTNTFEKAPGTLPWFTRWFDSSHYHKLYANRDDKEAALFIDELISHLDPMPGSTMLDLGCGAGRHCKRLAAKGFNVTGIDLASSSIQQAKKFESDSLHFFRQDMRVPFGKSYFDYVFSFFTSFGYFKEQDANEKVIANISTSLKPGGRLVMDFINVAHAESRNIPEECREIDGITYNLTRWMDDKHFFKKIVIGRDQFEQPFEYIEQVAKLRLHDFEKMFAPYSLRLEEVYGDYRLDTYDSKTSPRMIMIARKIVNSEK